VGNKILTFLKKNWLLILILAVGLFLRLYNGKELFGYDHDQDLAGWIIKDIVVNHHLRLIGQLTSTPGVFIGPLFYYLLIPFYLAFKMDPIGGIYLIAFIGLFAIWSAYFVFSKVFNRNVGIIGALIYAISPYTVFNDRNVVPTMPLMLWAIWFLYSNFLIIKGDQKKGFILSAVLVALIWHINFGLAILLPIYFVSLILSKKKIDFKALLISFVVLVLLSSPLILFEVRHGFSQTKAVIYSATASQGDVLKGFAKIAKVYDVVTKDVTNILWGYPAGVPKPLAFWIVLPASIFVFIKRKIKKGTFLVMALWLIITAGFFSLYSKPVSEYYLDSLTIVWIAFISVIISSLIESKKLKIFGYVLIVAFIIVSANRFITYPVDKNGYVERNEVISYIKSDAALHNYPCVAISYITDPGYNLGYRYFIYLDNLKTKDPSSNAPVYSIVFPLSKVNKLDKTFGALGVINPDYSRYNKTGIVKFCQGDNANLTDSMFGYTQ
jgi:4-amino-4-deoxy-L-arabinose transferase-like glycosyltransferase